ncbi:hypothetical protein B0H13DRAFT_2032961 [Mycena leptocephala]|nr:hypothetical protein B0H13DRAFT_2032961 [Mycena leptocephala]
MFEPFEDATDFYPGLIVWCDPTCYEPELSAGLSTLKLYDRRKSRELRPCLVISVNHNSRTFQAARLSATTPTDPSQWVKIDSPPAITWKLNDAWVWVGAPPTVAMVFGNPKIMHRTLALFQYTAGVFKGAKHQRTKIPTTACTLSLRTTSKTIGCTDKPTSIDRCATRVLDVVLNIPTRNTVSIIVTLIVASLRPLVLLTSMQTKQTAIHRQHINNKSRHTLPTTQPLAAFHTFNLKTISRVPPSTVFLPILLWCHLVSPKLISALLDCGAIQRLARSGTPAVASCLRLLLTNVLHNHDRTY